jgi:hypothetical protein
MTKKPWEGDEQGERIADAYDDLMKFHKEQGTTPLLSEWEDVFEDRDPFEFL